MYMNKLFSAVVVLALFTSNVKAQLKGQYPPVDKVPPFKPEWSNLVDETKLAPAPIRTPPAQCNPVDTYCVWSCTNCMRETTDVRNCPNKSEWALTYDDGPSNNTLVVLNELKSRGLKATFFVIGSRVLQYPDILQKVVDDGHQIAVHTWSHSPLTSLTNQQIIAEVKWTEQAIFEAVKLTPKWFRPPQGDFDDRVRGILTQLGYKTALWDLDTFDWTSKDNPNFDLNWITANFSQWVQNTTSKVGHISLEHDIYERPVTVAGKAMDIVLNAKFTPQSLSVCLGDKQPYVQNVELPKSKPRNDKPTPNQPPSISATGLIENNLLLSIACGLIMMMIFGFIETVSI